MNLDKYWWSYDNLPSGEPYDWGGAARTDNPDDNIDFHLDLGAGRLPKARLAIDRFDDPAIDFVIDLNDLGTPSPGTAGWERAKVWHEARNGPNLGQVNPMEGLIPVLGRLPFPNGSIQSIITHHCFEHIGEGFVRLMDECHRILVPGGKLRVIVPLFPSTAAVADPDHKRYFMLDSFLPFFGAPDGSSWMESFSTPYSQARFKEGERDYTARSPNPDDWWGEGQADHREMRITLEKY